MIRSYIQALRLFNRDVRLYLVASTLFGFTVFGGIYPILLNLFLLRLGYGPEFIGLLNASGSLAIAIFCLPAGALGSRWGSRQTMVAGLICLAAGNGLLPLAEVVPVASRGAWLLTTNLFGALGVALYIVNGSPYLMAVTGDTERNYAFSAQAALGPLAAFAGSLAGGLLPGLIARTMNVSLDQPAPYGYPLILAAILLLPAGAALLAMRDVRGEQGAPGSAGGRPAPYGLIGLLALVVMLQVAGEGVTRTFFNVYMDAGLHVSTAQIGLVAALGQLLAAPAALMAPLLMARWGSVRTFTAAALGMSCSLLPLAFVPTWRAAGFGFMGVMMLAAVSRPVISLYNMAIVAPAWWNLTAGATTMAVGLSWAIMGIAGGYIIATLGYPSLFATGALVTAAGAVLFWSYFRVPRGRFARPAPD